jgi:ABC-type transporter MlaC component
MPIRFYPFISLFFITITSFTLAQAASASVSVSASSKQALAMIQSGCSIKPEQLQEIERLKNRIASADNLSLARELALKPTGDALSALDKAKLFAPFSNDITAAHARLTDARERLLAAASQKQVADEFEGIMVAGLDNDRAAHVNIGSGSCDYSTGELIAIVVGLILGIIPGIILLVVLC